MTRNAIVLVAVAGLLALLGSVALAHSFAPLSQEEADNIVLQAQAGFWGRAIDGDGRVIQPEVEEERSKLPIPEEDVDRIVQQAFVYGLAHWCELAWKDTYADYMRYERYKGWDEKQAAFIGFLFGTTQGFIRKRQGDPCDQDAAAEVGALFEAEKQRVQRQFQQADHAVCFGYLYGKGRDQDFAKALKWCTRAASAGLPESQTLLGEMYLFGYGVEKNASTAAEWYRRAAEQGFAHAQYVLAGMCLEGIGVSQDRSTALGWLHRAAAQGYEPATKLLADLEAPSN